ncbi:MAG: HEAT repeat domain-containing protein [Acidobacteriota bacterium]|nr:HEAT repeat domain-containing protein [Acidobacteriota bacterium]
MLSNLSEFEVLLERYDGDPGFCSKILRTHALSDPKTFLVYARKALLARPVSRALKFIAGLAISAGLIETLLDLYPRSREEAITLAHKAIACEPRFDTILLEFLQRPRPAQAGEENLFHIGLDILDAISPGDRLVAGVLKILKHPNPKVRSKAALFVGSRTQNLAWAANRTQDYDPRVRANILESLHGLNSDFVVQMFRDNVADENNRVAGNAVLGLYLLGDTNSISLIYEMTRHTEPRFRNTASWLMGRTGDPRFALAFSELMNDSDEIVRAQAFKGLGEVRKAMRAAATRPQLKAAIVKASVGSSPELIATVRDAAGQPVHGIAPTSFIVKTGTPARAVRNYTVNEYDCRSSLSVAFIMCLPADDESGAELRFARAIQACNGFRRSKDRWAIVKISPHSAVNRAGTTAYSESVLRMRQKWSILHVDDVPTVPASTPQQNIHGIEYSTNQLRIDAMLRDNPIALSESPSDEAAKTVLNSLLRGDIGWTNPHLIFLGASASTHLIQTLLAKGQDLAATIHVLAQSPSWETGEAARSVEATGGTCRNAADNNALPDICAEIYASLLHHYRIGWQEGIGNIELDIYSETGKASTMYEVPSAYLLSDRLSA